MSQLADVPTIDISPLSADGPMDSKMQVAQEIEKACHGSGFFYAANHGIDVLRLQEVVNEFHKTMTDEEKWRLAINAYNASNPHVRNGYYLAIKGKKAVESFCYLNPSFTSDHSMIQAETPMHEVNMWPDEERHLGFRSFCEEYYWDMLRLSSMLLRGFALALGQAEDFFDAEIKPADTLSSVSLIRYPYLADYPPVKTAPDGTKLSFEDHRDASIITVLYQTPVPNLQVDTATGYQDVPTSEDCYLINCGTYMARLTNDYFPAPVHRVTFVNAERLSLPFFVHAGHSSSMEPVTPYGSSDANSNPTIPYGQYLQHGLRDLILKNGQT